jgi:hypothetical protein
MAPIFPRKQISETYRLRSGGNMLKLFVVVMFLVQGAFAANVEVKIDGEQYYCSKDPNSTGTSDANCTKAVTKFTQMDSACKSAGNYANNCFSTSYSSLTAEEKSCPEVREACNSMCKSAGNYANNCFSTCY